MARRSLVSMGELAALMAGLVWLATVPVGSQSPSRAQASGAAGSTRGADGRRSGREETPELTRLRHATRGTCL